MTYYNVYSIGTIQNKEGKVCIKINPHFIPALKSLDGFSHIQVLWWCHDFDNK